MSIFSPSNQPSSRIACLKGQSILGPCRTDSQPTRGILLVCSWVNSELGDRIPSRGRLRSFLCACKSSCQEQYRNRENQDFGGHGGSGTRYGNTPSSRTYTKGHWSWQRTTPNLNDLHMLIAKVHATVEHSVRQTPMVRSNKDYSLREFAMLLSIFPKAVSFCTRCRIKNTPSRLFGFSRTRRG